MQRGTFCLLLLFAGVSLCSFAPNTRPVLPRVVRSVSLTNQTNPIPTTPLLTPTANALYRVSVYMVEKFPHISACGNTCGVLVANFQWTDDGGTQVMSSPGPDVALNTPIAINLAAAGGNTLVRSKQQWYVPSRMGELRRTATGRNLGHSR